MADADALIVRTRTRCDAALLEGSSVKVIALTAIGTDNVDLGFCEANGIFVQNASGCSSVAVTNYVFSALYGVAARKSIKFENPTIGIIGVGNTGRRVEHMAYALGFRVLKNDPPRAEAEGQFEFSTMDRLLAESDVVTMHVPLNSDTRGMVDAEFLGKMRPGAIFINASRGEIVDDDALKAAIPKLGAVIIDTWNNEPDIDKELVSMVDIATPHIAGYSYQSKQNGTASAVRTIARYFDIKPLTEFFPATDVGDPEAVKLDVRGRSQGQIASLFQYNYPIFTDDFMLRIDPSAFQRLRSEYSYRREFYLD